MIDKPEDRDADFSRPGFGPGETDRPMVQGYEPDMPRVRDELRDRQPLNETTEAADSPGEQGKDDGKDPPVARIGAETRLP